MIKTPIKTLTHPVTGKTVRLGRRRPIARGPRFALRNYVMKAMPAPPLTCDYTKPAVSALANVYLNDTLGDCVCAGLGHVGGVLTGNAGTAPLIFTNDQIVFLYSAIGGYDPSQTQPDGSNPTDQGCDEQTALNYFQQHGLLADGSHKAQAWISIDGTNQAECMTALWLFENLFFGIELPDAWISPFPSASGFTWDVAGDPDPSNGHCVTGFAYNSKGVTIDSWGMLGTLTWPAIAKYASTIGSGELYAILSPDAIAKATQKAPNGFDVTQLAADIASMSPA